MRKDLRKIAKQAEAQGWRIEARKSGHWAFFPPDKAVPPIQLSATPSDYRTRKNELAALKRRGLKGVK